MIYFESAARFLLSSLIACFRGSWEYCVLTFIFSVLYVVAPVHAIDLPVGADAPGFALTSLEGSRISLDDFKDRTLIFIYWRPDQDRSLKALEDGQNIFSRFHDKGVQVIGITADNEQRDRVHRLLTAHGITYPVLIDADRQLYSAYGIRVYPTTVVVNRAGRIAYALPSHPITYLKTLDAHVRHIIGEIDEQELHDMVSPHSVHLEESVLIGRREYNLALKFMEVGLFDMAIKAAGKSIEANPGVAESHTLLGFLYLERNEADKAHHEFSEALKLNAHSQDAKTGLGSVLILKGDIDNAIDMLIHAASANPNPEMTYYELGRAYEIKGDESKSKEMYKKALEKIIHKKVIPSSISRCR